MCPEAGKGGPIREYQAHVRGTVERCIELLNNESVLSVQPQVLSKIMESIIERR